MPNEFTTETKYVIETCIECGMQFAIPADYQKHLMDTHNTFKCPKGHSQYYPADNEVEKLKKQVHTLKESLAWYEERLKRVQGDLDHERKRVLSYQGHAAKYKRKLEMVNSQSSMNERN